MGRLADNTPDRVVDGTRILTEERLRSLSGRSLRSYYRRVKQKREAAHSAGIEYRDGPYVIEERPLTSEEIAAVKAFDYAFGACQREFARRQVLNGDLDRST